MGEKRTMINNRQIELLEILLISDNPITSTQLSKNLGVSTRTIRMDIVTLNGIFMNENIKVQGKNPYGYYFNQNEKDKVKEIIRESKIDYQRTKLPQTPSERQTYILLDLLFNNEYQVMQKYCDELFVSKSTINNDIHVLVDYLNSIHSNAVITIDRNGAILIGEESEKRKNVARFIVEQTNGLNQLYQSMNLIEPGSKLSTQTLDLYERLIGLLEKHQIYLSDQDIQSLIFYFIICVKRFMNGNNIEINDRQAVNDIVVDILRILEDIFDTSLTDEERRFIQKIFDTKSMILTNQIGSENEEINQIIDLFLQQVKKQYELDFTDNLNLKQFLTVHIRSMINRIKFNASENNPLKDDIKKKFPLATEISFLLYNILKDEKNLIMNDSEISYIALHIASALEVFIKPSLVCLVSDLNQSTSRLLATKLMHVFGNKIQIVFQLTVYQYNKYIQDKELNVDLVITTTNIQTDKIPVVKVNPLLFRDDIANIKHYIHYFSMELRSKDYLYEIFDERLFHKLSDFYEYTSVIRFLVSKLKIYDYIEDENEYYNLVLEREKTYSTIMENRIAIPHAIENKARKTVIAVAILDKVIVHEGKEVQIVLLNAINEKENLQNLYTTIERILALDNISDLLNSQNCNEFIKTYQSNKEKK